MFVRCSHLQDSALRFECRPLETQMLDVSETFLFCPCFKDLEVGSLGQESIKGKREERGCWGASTWERADTLLCPLYLFSGELTVKPVAKSSSVKTMY